MTLVPSKAMVRKLRWHLVLKVATTLVTMMSSVSSLLESMGKCTLCSERTTVGFFLTQMSVEGHDGKNDASLQAGVLD